MTPQQRRSRFFDLHARDGVFVMPNPWDVGSAKLLAGVGFEALATTSAGFAWSQGRDDYGITRDHLVDHVGAVAAATDLPLNVDSERCFADDGDLVGVAATVRLLHDAGAAGCSIEDWNGPAGRIDPIDLATERVAAAAAAAHAGDDQLVLTARCENLLHGVDDLDDTIARLVAYRDAGADCLYAPGLRTAEQIRRVVDAVDRPINVLALPGGPDRCRDRRCRRPPRLDRRVARQLRLRSAHGRSTRAPRHGHQHLRLDPPEQRRPRPARLTMTLGAAGNGRVSGNSLSRGGP